MNIVNLIGRLTADPVARYTQGQNPQCVANYTLAVDRPKDKDGNRQADFIRCVAWGKRGEFAQKYLRKGTQIAVSGRIQTGSYEDRNGNKVYTTDVMVNEHYFCGSGSSNQNEVQTARNDFAPANENPPRQWTNPSYSGAQQGMNDGFMPIDEELESDGDLPF